MPEKVHESNTIIGKDRVRLTLYQVDGHLMMERELVQSDGEHFVHAFLLDGEAMLFGYMAADPYFLQLEHHYHRMLTALRQNPGNLAGQLT